MRAYVFLFIFLFICLTTRKGPLFGNIIRVLYFSFTDIVLNE